MKRVIAAAFASGALFGVGLAVSGMTDARRILGFLDVAGAFDPTLAFVLAGAVATTLLLFRPVLRRGRPLFDDAFRLPRSTQVDARLLGGAALFGVGWGLAGYWLGTVRVRPWPGWARPRAKPCGSCPRCWWASRSSGFSTADRAADRGKRQSSHPLHVRQPGLKLPTEAKKRPA